MPGALTRIESIYKNLPPAEKRVADYVLKHPENVPFHSVSQLAGTTKVSVASVSRLSKKLGYKNFRDFKIEVAQQEAATNIDTIYQAINGQDSDKNVVKKVFAGNIKSLDDTLSILDIPMLIKTAKIISRTKKLVFMGIGSSANIASDAALRFSHLGFPADAYTDSYQMLIQASQLKAKEVAFGISHSGRSRTTVEGLKLAQEKGAVTIGISNYAKSPLNKASDIFLCTSFPESRARSAALSSRLSQMCLIDSLYVLAVRHKKNLRVIERLNGITEKLLRLPDKK